MVHFNDLLLSRKMNAKRLPIAFELEITARCNNNCIHCYNNLPANDQNAKRKELTIKNIFKIIDEAASLGVIWCRLTGGEPLLRDDFNTIYLYLKKKGFLVTVFTNANLLSKKHVELFKKYPPSSIEISVYGVNKETYEKITRKPGSFEKFFHGLSLLKEHNIEYRLKTMVMKSNVHEFKNIIKFCEKNTCDYFRFDPYLHLRVDRNQQRNEEILSERLESEDIISIENEDPKRIDFLKKECSNSTIREFSNVNHAPLFLCGTGNDSFSVGYNGFFRLCPQLVHPDTLYDLKEGNVYEAWHNFVPVVRRFCTENEEYIEKCFFCHIKNICFWCPANAYLETGFLDKHVKYFCNIAKERARLVMKNK